ncbi:MAG: hypothetical protein ACOYJE_08980 [Bacteroidaceae bacterium]|jgi:hypothetical protein
MNRLNFFQKLPALFRKSAALFPLGLLLFAGACSDEDFSTSPADQPFFMADTLFFDTLISTVPSSTRQIVLYNPNDKDLRIERIALRSQGSSGFMINVDGQPGNDAEGNYQEISDVEIWRQDSLYILVEARLPEQGASTPQHVTDEIIVQTNGETRSIVLSAYAQDALILHGHTISQDTVLSAGKPLVVYDSLVVPAGVTLTCQAGARLMFHNGAGLSVHGTLITEGTATQPVVFRSDRMDRLFSYLPYDNTPGLWEGIHFHPESEGNVLAFADIHSANTAVLCSPSADRSQQKLVLYSTRIHNSAYNALQLWQCNVEATNCLFSNSGQELVSLTGTEARFVHCSLLNFYPFAAHDDALLRAYSDQAEEGNGNNDPASTADTTRVWLLNCLLSGKENSTPDHSALTAEEKGLYIAGDEATVFIEHATAISDNEHYVNLNERGDYQYDFHPTAENLGVNALTSPEAQETAQGVPQDLDGNSRIQDGAPDAGCYEYQQSAGTSE